MMCSRPERPIATHGFRTRKVDRYDVMSALLSLAKIIVIVVGYCNRSTCETDTIKSPIPNISVKIVIKIRTYSSDKP